MSDEKTNQENTDAQNRIDLSSLSNLEFKTAWTPASSPTERDFPPRGKSFGRRDSRGERGNRDSRPPRGERRDVREGGERKSFGSRPPFGSRNGNQGGERAPKRFSGRDRENGDQRGGRNFPPRKHMPFNPTMEVLFYPDDTPFDKLSAIMKASKRTYQLFDIAQLVLEKPERYVVLAKNLPMSGGETKPLYCAQPLNIPYDDEQTAKHAAVEHFVDELFTKEEIETEAPKGNFQVVNKSSITGELLGAPNWHRYGEYLREYHAEKCPNMPFERFTASIESVRDADQIAAWLESMKKRTVYKLKSPSDGENEVFDTREAASNYVSHKMGDQLVKTYEQVRLKGANLQLLPFGRIRRNIEEACKKQKRFPIVTANNLRGRLRRSGFAVYKRGSKGFAFVSVVKRKFLFEGDKLSELPQQIFDYILANAGTLAHDLPYKMLSLTPPAQKPKEKTLAEANRDGGANVSPADVALGNTEISDENKSKMAAIWSELTWLVAEGYVVEYSDGTLQANPFLPRPKGKDAEAKQPDEHVNLGEADEPIVSPAQAPKSEDEKPEPLASESEPDAEESPESSDTVAITSDVDSPSKDADSPEDKKDGENA